VSYSKTWGLNGGTQSAPVSFADFIERKSQLGGSYGFDASLPDFLFDFQQALVSWALNKGRACVMWSNPGEIVLTPFMGVGSEVFGSVINGRRAIGVELKESYYRQAQKNLELASAGAEPDEESLFNPTNMMAEDGGQDEA
jgi:hypothetical protein